MKIELEGRIFAVNTKGSCIVEGDVAFQDIVIIDEATGRRKRSCVEVAINGVPKMDDYAFLEDLAILFREVTGQYPSNNPFRITEHDDD